VSNDHAPLAPSSAARWVQCPGSVVMSRAFPDDMSDPEASEEGTLAHAVAAGLLRALTSNTPAMDVGAFDATPEATTCSSDEEMFEAVTLYVDRVRAAASQPEHVELHVESKATAPHIHSDNWGTPDAWLFNRAKMRLDVFDLKYGYGIVEVFENWQLLNYASAIAHTLGLDTADTLLSVNLHIVQPRAYHRNGPVRSWSLSGEALRGYTNRLGRAASAALMSGPNPECITGDECRYCPARHACPALLTVGYGAIESSGVSVPLDMPPDVMGMLLRQVRDGIKRLEAIETGLEQQALAAIRSGRRVSGWHAESGAGRERWRVSYDEVLALGAAMGIEVAKPALITPKQAVKAGLPREVVDCYTETPAGEVKLVADDGRLACVFGKGAE